MGAVSTPTPRGHPAWTTSRDAPSDGEARCCWSRASLPGPASCGAFRSARTRRPEGPMSLSEVRDHWHGRGMTDVHAMRGTFAEPLSANGGEAVVVGYDESSEGVNALGWAAAHAEAFGVPLRVVYA